MKLWLLRWVDTHAARVCQEAFSSYPEAEAHSRALKHIGGMMPQDIITLKIEDPKKALKKALTWTPNHHLPDPGETTFERPLDSTVT